MASFLGGLFYLSHQIDAASGVTSTSGPECFSEQFPYVKPNTGNLRKYR
jgi:hypothetical protein